MAILRPVLKSVIGAAVRKVIDTAAAIQRYFLPFDPVLQSYGLLEKPFQPAGDFEIEFDFTVTPDVDQAFLGGTIVGNNDIRFYYVAAGNTFRVNAWVGGTTQGVILGYNVADGKLHTARLTYTGTTVELFLDGVSQGTNTWNLNGSQDIKNIGRRSNSTHYLNGYMANLNLTDLVDPLKSQTYALDTETGTQEICDIEGRSRVFADFDKVVESHITFSPITLTGDFEVSLCGVIPSGGCYFVADTTSTSGTHRLAVTGSGTFVGLGMSNQASSFTPNGKLNHLRVVRTSGAIDIWIDGVQHVTAAASTASVTINSAGSQHAGTTGIPFFDGILCDVRIIDKVTTTNSVYFKVDQLTGTTENSLINSNTATYVNLPEANRSVYTEDLQNSQWVGANTFETTLNQEIEINNIPDADRELFTFDETNDRWVGEELVTNGGFDTDTGWAKSGGGWSISGGTANCSGDQVANTDIYKAASITDEGVSYLSVFNVTDFQNGVVKALVGGAEGSARSTTGVYTEVITSAVGAGTRSGVRGNFTFEGSVDNVSIKRILEVVP